MATTANKNCKQFIGIVTGEDGITARSGDEPGKGVVRLKTAEINESESTSSETVYQISETGSTDVEVFNQSDLTFAEGEEVQIWQDGYGVFWIIPIKDNRDFFVIKNTDGVTNYAKKGKVFFITRGTYSSSNIPAWVIKDSRSHSAYRFAVCQEDMPDDYFDDPNNTHFFMPYYTPEMNYGERPAVASPMHTADGIVSHRGVIEGEHEFSTKRLDYVYQHGEYSYCPTFTYTGTAVNYNGGVGIDIEGHTYSVQFPAIYNGMGGSIISYPDVYAGDEITVLVIDGGGAAYGSGVYAIKYPTDYAKGSVVLTPDFTYQSYRGWNDATSFYPGLPTGIYVMEKVQGNALI